MIKYTTARTASGNYDFMIAKYGYQWFLDHQTLQEAIDQLKVAEKLDGVDLDLIPEEGKMNVEQFLSINSKNSLNLKDMEDMKDYFRGISENNLAHLCPKLKKS